MRGRRAKKVDHIRDEAALKRALSRLREQCAVMRALHDATGDPPLRRYPKGFMGVARIVVGQQVSAASARAIWKRTEETIQPFTPSRILAMSDENLRSAGLSRPKVATLRALSSAVRDGLDIDNLSTADDAEVHRALTAVRGIGPWTVDIYLLFALGRADSWPAGDLALQIAAARALRLKQRPDAKRLISLAERWRPLRSVAAMLLWSYYALPPDRQAAATPAKFSQEKQLSGRSRLQSG